MAHGVMPEPPAGSEQWREGWRDGYAQAEIEAQREQPAPGANEILQAFRTLRRHLPAHLRELEAELEAAWFRGEQPAPPSVDWPARFRAAAEVADARGWLELGAELAEISSYGDQALEAIGRALTGEESQ